MTGRTGLLSQERSMISESDAARIAAEEEMHQQWQRRAARVVAAGSHDVADCRLLLDILGLDTATLTAARAEQVAAAASHQTSSSHQTSASNQTSTVRKRRSHAA
jgi:hypothetical protein